MEFLSLTGDVTRAHALEHILTDSVSDEDDSELCLHAAAIDAADVVTATATRMRIARHMREHPHGGVTIVPPRRSALAARFIDLLSPLPDDVILTDPPNADAPAHYALMPATVVPDTEAVPLLGEYAYDMSIRARISRQRAGFITAAVMELSDNALRHGTGARDQPVIAVTSFGRERHVEIAVTDAGTALSEATDPAVVVRTIPGRAIKGDQGFLGQILRRGRQAGVEVRVELMAGTARLRWSSAGHRTERHRHVPGTTVVARIGA